MLILTLHKGQYLKIGSEIIVQIKDHIQGGYKIAVEAPKSLAVHRYDTDGLCLTKRLVPPEPASKEPR